MNVAEFAEHLLCNGDLDDKLLDPGQIQWETKISLEAPQLDLTLPTRSKRLSFSSKRAKFPKIQSFHQKEARFKAIHFFANHELLAIEMMAAFILRFENHPLVNTAVLKGVISTIQDEQLHLKLYQERLLGLGGEFGELPLNDFFWKQMSKVSDPSQFFSLMALTFESANLDFAQFYESIFKSNGDHKSAQVMDIILRDEIKHVAFGVKWLNLWRKDKNLWDYYLTNLPEGITPNRAKGTHVNEEARIKAGLSPEFIQRLNSHEDSHNVTQRRSWKNQSTK